MVMDYKIHYQYQVRNYLYFYECDGNLCTMEVEDETKLLYSKYDCGDGVCPVFKSTIGDDYVILEDRDRKKNMLFHYRLGKVISESYEDYLLIDSKHFIVFLNGLQGVIDMDNRVIVPILYDQIGYFSDHDDFSGYNFFDIIVKKGDKYGIVSYKDGSVVEDFLYSETELDILFEKLKEESVGLE